MSRSVCAVLAIMLLSGAGCTEPPQRSPAVDLGKVLAAFAETFDLTLSPLGNPQPLIVPAGARDASLSSGEHAQRLQEFAEQLEEAELATEPIGVQLLADGGIEGYLDLDTNGRRNGTPERQLFVVRFDGQRGRLLASDNHGHHRLVTIAEPPDPLTWKLLVVMQERHRRYFESGLKPAPDFERIAAEAGRSSPPRK